MALDAGITNALVGLGHPRVTEAIARQLASPEDDIRERYIARLLTRFPEPLSVCYLVHSVSEATEVALRLARVHRPGKDVIVHDDTDHGMTTSLASMSPSRRKFWVHAAARGDASQVAECAQAIESGGRGLCAFFAEGTFDPGYLEQTYATVRAAGGLNVALEMQTGMGRVGEPFWEFARHGVTPDIVVIGDSMGNGFPMSAVVTRPDLGAPFDTGTGGGPVACAAGLAVLDVLRPPQWSPDFSAFTARGAGLCWEIDVPDAPLAIQHLHERGILIAARGNTLIFRPPLTFSMQDAADFHEGLRMLPFAR
ncbi:MAG: aminotransferase class III-fold pyridoxal phosphate-dependent enzyme [Bryobacteraceae bacterium]